MSKIYRDIEDKYLQFDFVRSNYEGIYEIYCNKCMNTFVLQKVLRDFINDGYKLYRVFNDYIRAMK